MRPMLLLLSLTCLATRSQAGEPSPTPSPFAEQAQPPGHEKMWTSAERLPPRPAAKKALVRDGMTMLQLVQALGPGWCPRDNGIGILRWAFADGSCLRSRAYGPEVVLTFDGRAGTGQMTWEAAPSTGRTLTIASFSNLPDQLTFAGLVLKVGEPDEDIGSGVYLYLYHLADGSTVIVRCLDSQKINTITHRVKHKNTQIWPNQ